MAPRAPADDLVGVLRARGLRATPQRRDIFAAVAELGHGTAEQVCQHLQRQGAARSPAVNLSTVYRTLELLDDLGVVAHTHLGHGAPSYYPAAQADHLHLVCRRCGRVEEAELSSAVPLADAVARRHGFATDLSHLSLHGVCARCAGEDDGDGREALEGPGR